MSRADEVLRTLLRAAAQGKVESAMPYGFDTRVLALVREARPNGSAHIALYARRASALALAIIILALAGLYGVSPAVNNAEISNEYSMADSVIATNLGE